MSGRYVYEYRKKGDVPSPLALDVGKKLLDYLAEQRRLGAAKTVEVTRKAPDGTVVTARFNGDLPEVLYSNPERRDANGNLVHLYTSSSSHGLCVFDLYAKRMVKNFTGLEAFSLLDVDSQGHVAYMGTSTLAARVDMRDITATGKTYAVRTSPFPADDDPEPTVVGIAAEISNAKLSPDGTRVAFVYDAAGLSGSSSVLIRDGYGAVILADAETMEPIRGPIRGGVWNVGSEHDIVAWSSDGEHFFVPSVFNYDIGDLTSTGQFPLFYQSDHHYLAKYTRDGEFVDAVSLATWGTPEVSARDGMGMMVREVVREGDRLYVGVISWFGAGTGVYILDEDLNILDYKPVPDFYSFIAQIVVRGNTMVLQGRDPDGTLEDTYLVYNVSDDEITYKYKTKDVDAVFGRMGFGVRARADGTRDGLLYAAHAETGGGALQDLRGYNTLKGDFGFGTGDEGNLHSVADPVYKFDLTPWNSRFDWHMVSVGPTEARTPA